MNTAKKRSWILAIAIFLLGAIAGATATMFLGVRLLRRTLQSPVENRSFADRAAQRVADDLIDTLQLTPEQAAHVRGILADSAGHMKAIRANAARQAASELAASTNRIAAALPPEKHEAFYRVIAQRYERLGLPAPQPLGP